MHISMQLVYDNMQKINFNSLYFSKNSHFCKKTVSEYVYVDDLCNTFMDKTVDGYTVDMGKSDLSDVPSSKMQSMFFDKDGKSSCTFKRSVCPRMCFM
jgi:hypothetical protein